MCCGTRGLALFLRSLSAFCLRAIDILFQWSCTVPLTLLIKSHAHTGPVFFQCPRTLSEVLRYFVAARAIRCRLSTKLTIRTVITTSCAWQTAYSQSWFADHRTLNTSMLVSSVRCWMGLKMRKWCKNCANRTCIVDRGYLLALSRSLPTIFLPTSPNFCRLLLQVHLKKHQLLTNVPIFLNKSAVGGWQKQLSRHVLTSPGNYEVGVHIADVSYFVKPNTELDRVAGRRCTSVYMAQMVVPMLPRMLCEKLCSLNPGEDRLAFSAVWKVTEKGKVKSCLRAIHARKVHHVLNAGYLYLWLSTMRWLFLCFVVLAMEPIIFPRLPAYL